MKVKGISWVGVGTDHYAETLRLFTEVMGMKVLAGNEAQAILEVGEGQQLEIFGDEGRGKGLNSPPTAAFEVEDFAAACDELRQAGVELVGEPGAWNGYHWQYFRSPDGYLFEIKTSPPGGWPED